MSQPFFNHVFKNRFDEEYYDYLIDLLTDIEKLCKNATGIPKPCRYKDGTFDKGIQLDFCGLAATTLLGIDIENDRFASKRIQIKNAFANLLSSETVKQLNDKGIYIKVRFALSYLYSSFASCLINAESSFNRPHSSSRALEYDFNLDEFNIDQIKDSLFKERQRLSLIEIASIVDKNPFLVITKSNKNDNTLQVRFSLLPLPLCLLIVNDQVISDPYLYTQERTEDGKTRNLFYNYPLSVFQQNEKKQKIYYDYVANHFDYIWHNDLTLLCRDSTKFDIQDNSMGLAEIRKPNELKWDQKEKRVREHLEKRGKKFTEETIVKWRELQPKKIAPYIINFPSKIVEKEGEIKNNVEITPSTKNVNKNYNNSWIKIWIDDAGKFCFELQDCKQNFFSFESKRPEKIFIVFLHYSFAIKYDKVPILHKKHPRELKIFSEILSPLNHCNKGQVVGDLRETLFDANNHHNLKISKQNIDLGDNIFDQAKTLKYGNFRDTPNFNKRIILNRKQKIYPVLWYSDDDSKLFPGIEIF